MRLTVSVAPSVIVTSCGPERYAFEQACADAAALHLRMRDEQGATSE